MRRACLLGAALAALAALTVTAAGPAAGDPESLPNKFASGQGPAMSGVAEFRDVNYGTGLTECPQARMDKFGPLPLDRRQMDRVEQYSDGGDDRRTNEEYFCFPQNETSIDTNPVLPKNIVAGANDYRMGWGSSGFYASTDHGQKWYGGITPFPTVPAAPGQRADDHIDGGGDPAIVFDRAGIVYYAQIRFERERDDNGIWVNRSTNGGFTWSRPCTPIDITPRDPTDDAAVCGGAGDPRQPGDGTVTYQQDPDGTGPLAPPFEDKEYIAAGPRPFTPDPTDDPNQRIGAVCFSAIQRTPIPEGQPGCPSANIGVDRIYVTWTRFADDAASPVGFTANIMISFSDDQARSWSPPRVISGSAPLCGSFNPAGSNRCDLNQFSVPTVHPHTGLLGVAFENFNTPDENQYMFVRSRDGGVTFEGPFFVTPVFDVTFPFAGGVHRPDCTQRGQGGGRIVYSNSCFRSNAGGNVVVDKRGGDFADDFYLVMSDNRNGTAASTNSDVFLFKSTDGGTTWIGPSRVNNDRSEVPANFDRTCPPVVDTDPTQPGIQPGPNPDCPPTQVFGNDQWWPWVDINNKGHLNVAFKDRRLDLNSVDHEWPTTRALGRPGNYLVWTWGAQCTIDSTATVTGQPTSLPAGALDCVAPGAGVVTPELGECLSIDPGPPPRIIVVPGECLDVGEDPVPGQGQQFRGPFHNFGISDFPSNYDYCFRAGIFCGDYDVVATDDNDTKVYSHFTDARNGRSSRQQQGRNPACEQSDVMVDLYSSTSADAGQKEPRPEDAMFLVTPCPTDIQEP
jgi:hypothetical protein